MARQPNYKDPTMKKRGRWFIPVVIIGFLVAMFFMVFFLKGTYEGTLVDIREPESSSFDDSWVLTFEDDEGNLRTFYVAGMSANNKCVNLDVGDRCIVEYWRDNVISIEELD